MVRKALLAATTVAVMIACQNPLAELAAKAPAGKPSGSSGRAISLSWHVADGSTGVARTILPSFPSPSTYDVVLHPATGSEISETGLTTTSWTFNNLSATTYTISVTGFDGSGNAIVSGTGSADLTSAASQSPTIALSYVFSGSGTGQINVTFDVSSSGVTVTSTSLTLVDPAGTVSTPSLTGSSPTFTYTNSSAAVGSWKMFAKLSGGDRVAIEAGTIVVAQNVDTAQTITLGAGDFNNAYVAVTGLSVSPHTMSLTLGSATGNTGALTTSLTPSNASNTLVTWSSSDSSIASVDQSGVVTAVGMGGPVTITAASVDNPSAHDSSSVTVYGAVSYDGNGATSGTAPVDSNGYAAGQTVTVAGNTGNLVKTGYAFTGWNTQADGNGTTYTAGATFPMGSAPVTLYADWVELSAPTFSIPAGTYFTAQSVVISDATSGATVYYTTDGTTPTTSSAVYSGGTSIAVAVNATPVTIKAIAVLGTTASAVTSGTYSVVQTAKWAESSSGSNTSSGQFFGGAVDSSGNLYAVGFVFVNSGTTIYFGSNNTIPVSTGGGHPLLVKYNSSGVAQWAAGSATGCGASFNDDAIGPDGSIYVVGEIGEVTCDFGNGVTVTGANSSGSPLVVKYNSAGTAVWAKVPPTSAYAEFTSVAVDSSGDVYVTGIFYEGGSSSGAISFSSYVTLNDPGSQQHGFLVKYDSSGTPQWARTVASGSGASNNDYPGNPAVDSSGNVYLPVQTFGAGTYDFGSGVSVSTGLAEDGVLVKFNSSGTAIWATAAEGQGYYSAAAIDSSGNIYVAGGGAAVLTKLDSFGSVLWTETAVGVGYDSIALDGSGHVYVAGTIGASLVDFGNHVYCSGSYSGVNALIVKYDTSGAAQWAQSLSTAPKQTSYASVGVDPSTGSVYATGQIASGTYGFGNGESAGASGASGPVVVGY